MADGLAPRIGAWVSVLAVLYLVIPHILFWSTGTLADGNHVAQDFHATGMSLSAMERVMGMVIAGLPVLFVSLSLLYLIRFFQGLDGTWGLPEGSSRSSGDAFSSSWVHTPSGSPSPTDPRPERWNPRRVLWNGVDPVMGV